MPLVIPVAHDFTCSWCWIGFWQTRELREEFGVEFDWLAYELYPEPMPLPTAPPPQPESPRPKTPSRLSLAYAAQRLAPPERRPPDVRTHVAHQAVEYAKTLGLADRLVEELYIAHWQEFRDIGDPGQILKIAEGLGIDPGRLRRSIEERRFESKITPFDAPAHATGVYNVPTYWIGGQRYAEQSMALLRKALVEEIGEPALYSGLTFPDAPLTRPYVVMNMVSTIDGKIITGNRDEPVMDLGSKVDHSAMRMIESKADAVMIGTGSLNATPGLWYDKSLTRIVVTGGSDLDLTKRFFSDAPERAFVLSPNGLTLASDYRSGRGGEIDFVSALTDLVAKGIKTLLVEGGSELNASLLSLDLVDELFLTIAPKVKLGRETPTYAGGDPLPRSLVQQYRLISEKRIGDEVFLRYRRSRS
ncbi:MAG TPA: dihydrofolate reductase family protein [Fimbriimonadaceae bacterium]|nr:dihydrofolate reductase family protein [Fimbriimonadaceae bacterium]